MTIRDTLFVLIAATLVLVPCLHAQEEAAGAEEPARPNILWIVAEDQSKHYGFNGEEFVHTPQLDRLAKEGVRFTQAMVTAPVCSTARSALITGMYQTSIGAHHHRSGRGSERIHLPDHVKLIPHYFREAGYYTCLGSAQQAAGKAEGRNKDRLGKSDYNFEWDQAVYDAAEWSGRAKGQPFFAQVMIGGGKARAQARAAEGIPHVKVEDVKLPPYYPDHPVVREDWAAYLDTFTLMDHQVGLVLERLREEEILDDTVIFFTTDHGVSHARGKQFCYDEGIMVPLVIHAPGRLEGGKVRDELVAHIDIAATSLYFAGIAIPGHLEARPLFGPQARPRAFVVSARDRCDETYDRIRSVRTAGWKYIRNGYPQRPHLQPCVYKDQKPIYQAIRAWAKDGKLDEVQLKLLLAPERAPEELYDLAADPWELNNLAADPEHAIKLAELRGTLDGWIEQTGDRGQAVEPIEMYDSDMKLYIDTLRKRKGDAHAGAIERNVQLMKSWWAAGR